MRLINWRFEWLVIAVLLVVIAVQGMAQDVTWWFTADVPVAIHAGRGLDTPKVRDLAVGEDVLLVGAYVQADDLIWAQIYGTNQFAAVARYGLCEIRSFGDYTPPEQAPISLGN